MIRIATGYSNGGGSTMAFINLTNALNKAGYPTILYGPHEFHLDKCKGALLADLRVGPMDSLVLHFLAFPTRPNCKKVILSCHEKDLFPVGKVPQIWDEVIFLNEKHREYHSDYIGKFRIIPNLKENLIKKDKTGLEKVAGVIGSFDLNKQPLISIQRALDDGMEKVYVWGDPNSQYFVEHVKPIIDALTPVEFMGFETDKQKIYDMIGHAYLSSKSECASLVKDECESTGVQFHGMPHMDNEPNLLTNNEILQKWINRLK